MQFRRALTRAPLGRTLTVLVLVLFVLLCGLHIAASHHDSHTDSFGLVSDTLMLLALVGFFVLVGFVGSVTRRSAPLLTFAAGAAASSEGRVPDVFASEAPLLC